MVPAILGILLHTDRILNVSDLHIKTRFNHDRMIGCLHKMEALGLISTIPSGMGFHSITVVQAAQVLKTLPPSLV